MMTDYYACVCAFYVQVMHEFPVVTDTGTSVNTQDYPQHPVQRGRFNRLYAIQVSQHTVDMLLCEHTPS